MLVRPYGLPGARSLLHFPHLNRFNSELFSPQVPLVRIILCVIEGCTEDPLSRPFAPLSALILSAVFSVSQSPAPAPEAPAHRDATLRQTQKLEKNWTLQSSCKVEAKGNEISRPAFKTAGWIETTVPSTVLAAQVHAGIFKDPFTGMNLRQIPGTTYEIGTVFSRRTCPQTAPITAPGGIALNSLSPPNPSHATPTCTSMELRTARTFG